MFRLHETTQRRVCRWAFVLLCAAPTLAAAVWVVRCHRPWRVQDEQQRLGAALHVAVRLVNWHEPRPGAFRTTSVELSDPSEPVGFAKLSKLEHLRAGDASWLTAQSVVIDVHQLQTLATRVPLWLAGVTDRELCFRCQRLTLHDPESRASTTYRNVEAVVRAGDGSRQVQLIARVDSDAVDAPQLRASLVWPANDATGDAMPVATVDAANAPLPLWLLNTLVPIGEGWGDAATFVGTVQVEFADNVPRGFAAGRLEELDLSTIVAEAGTHRAEGRASVDLDDLRWRGALVERVIGVFRAGNIHVSKSVLTAAFEQLFCGRPADSPTSDASLGDPIAVDAVSCRFSLDADGLALTGTLPESAGIPTDCIAAAAGRPLLATPPHARLHPSERLHPSAWVQFISGRTTGWVPATREAVDAASRLPLPPASTRAQGPTRPDEASLR